MTLAGFLLRRLGQGLLVMLAVALIAFAMVRSLGDPVASMVGQDTGGQERAALRESLGLDDPLPVQFLGFLRRAATGDFGVSYRQRQPVLAVIGERLPATVELAAASTILALAVGLPLGLLAAIRPRSLPARAVMAGSLIGISLPTFVLGLLLIEVFAVRLGWLPSFGRGTVTALGGWTTGLLTADGLRALVLPAVTLALFQTALIIRLVQAELREVLQAEFIRFGRARGLGPRALYVGHALRSALLPVVTIAGLQFGAVLAFSVITETVFQWPGVGLMFLTAIRFVDIPLMAAYLVLVALLFVLVNLAVDLLHLWIDPRLRRHRGVAG